MPSDRRPRRSIRRRRGARRRRTVRAGPGPARSPSLSHGLHLSEPVTRDRHSSSRLGDKFEPLTPVNLKRLPSHWQLDVTQPPAAAASGCAGPLPRRPLAAACAAAVAGGRAFNHRLRVTSQSSQVEVRDNASGRFTVTVRNRDSALKSPSLPVTETQTRVLVRAPGGHDIRVCPSRCDRAPDPARRPEWPPRLSEGQPVPGEPGPPPPAAAARQAGHGWGGGHVHGDRDS